MHQAAGHRCFRLSALSYREKGWGLKVFAILAMLYMLPVSYWEESMNTLSLVFVAIPLSVAIGVLLGVLSWIGDRIIQSWSTERKAAQGISP